MPVADIGNFDGPEANGKTFGGVAYGYSIGKYEVTNNQFVDFLNAKDPTGANTLSLYNPNMTSHATGGITYTAAAADGSKYTAKSGQGNKAVNFVTWFDSLRFTMPIMARAIPTETGAYTLLGGTATPSNAN